MRTLLIVNGNKAIKEKTKEFKVILRQYKEQFKGWGYTFKEVKPKNAKRPYYYWYKWEYSADEQNNIWTYIGKETPDINIPDPPVNPLIEIEYQVVGDNIIIQEGEYNKIAELFTDYQRFEINNV